MRCRRFPTAPFKSSGRFTVPSRLPGVGGPSCQLVAAGRGRCRNLAAREVDMVDDIGRRCADARQRLERRAHIASAPVTHYRLPPERSFTAQERGHVTILFGGLSARHERLIKAVFDSCGYTSQALPPPG